jgi:predicted enzyme related to lactoylglutathione lyase
MANPIVHFEVEATDIERAKKFYSTAFGWEMDQMGADFGNYVVIKTTEPNTPGAINGGMFQMPTKQLNAYQCVIAVDDIEKAMADVVAAGGKVLSEKPDDIPGVGSYAKCEDTEGNKFSLLQPAPTMMPGK